MNPNSEKIAITLLPEEATLRARGPIHEIQHGKFKELTHLGQGQSVIGSYFVTYQIEHEITCVSSDIISMPGLMREIVESAGATILPARFFI